VNGPSQAPNVKEQADALLAAVKALGGGASAPEAAALGAALRELDALRARYAQDPAPFADRLEQLRQARTTLDELLVRFGHSIAEGFVKATEAIREAEARRDEYRALLLHLNAARGAKNWSVGPVELTVQQFASVSLPESGTAGRVALEQYLEQHGRWRAVSILHRPALLKLLQDAALPEEDRKALARWCALESSHRISVRERMQGPPPPEDLPAR
jgi:hypothetical protein